MKKFIPVLIIILFLIQSCINGQSKFGVYQNEQIDQKLRNEIATMDKVVYADMCDNNFDALGTIMWDSLRDGIGNDFIKKFMPQMQRIMKGKNYRKYCEFYINNAKASDSEAINSGTGENKWHMNFTTNFKETYFSMLISGDSLNEVMLTIIYGKVKGKWLVCNIMGEDYSLGGRNAVEEFEYTRGLEKKGYLMDAVNNMTLVSDCLHPGGKFFNYSIAKDIMRFSDSLTAETKARYPFPYAVNEVKTKPLIVNLHLEVYNGKFEPMINYQTQVNVYDSVALKKENDEMQEKIGQIFKGMDQEHQSIIYRAYNDLPNGQNSPRYYGFIQKLK